MTVENNLNNHLKTEKSERKSCFFGNSSDNKSILCSRLFIAVAFTIVGFSAATFTYKYMENRHRNAASIAFENMTDFDDIIQKHHKLFVTNDLEKEILEFQKDMNERIINHQKMIEKAFDDKNSATNSAKVSTHEDDKNYFYELKFSGFNKNDISVKTDDGVISFSAKVNREVGEKDKKTSSASSFSYSFSLPNYDKKVKPEIIKEDNKIIVKLAKVKSKS